MKIKIIILLIYSIILSGCATKIPKLPTDDQNQLNEWLGEYSFTEVWPHAIEEYLNYVMVYEIYIYKEDDGQYYANIIIDGLLMEARWKATIQGDAKSIDLILESFSLDNLYIGKHEIGDLLFTLEKEGDKILTYWRKLVPVVTENQESGKVYFERY